MLISTINTLPCRFAEASNGKEGLVMNLDASTQTQMKAEDRKGLTGTPASQIRWSSLKPLILILSHSQRMSVHSCWCSLKPVILILSHSHSMSLHSVDPALCQWSWNVFGNWIIFVSEVTSWVSIIKMYLWLIILIASIPGSITGCGMSKEHLTYHMQTGTVPCFD